VELVSEPYSHSLAGLRDKNEFVRQIKKHSEKIKLLFGVKTKTFSNTELIYSDDLGVDASELGYTAMLTEGAKHILAWRSPNFLYYNTHNPKLTLFLRNVPMSEDLMLRFGNQSWENWPLTAEKFTDWMLQIPTDQKVVNLFIPYETLGLYQSVETGIFDFFNALPEYILQNTDFQFKTPQQILKVATPTSSLDVPYPISWFDEERDVTIWMGNEMQEEALSKLYFISDKINKCKDMSIKDDWLKLQSADNFFYMSTKWFSGSSNIRLQSNYYSSPYEAFINYMNILSDIFIRLDNTTK
jgi:alpha-amylase